MTLSTLGAFVINLDRKPERYRLFEETFQNSGLRYERVSACDGRELDIAPFIENLNPWFKVYGSEASIRGTIGCKRSHESLWHRISEMADGWYVIFEDDARLVRGRGHIDLPRILAKAPADADLVWLNEYDSTIQLHVRQRTKLILNRISGPIGLGSRLMSTLDGTAYALDALKFKRWFPLGTKTTEAYAIRPSFAGKLLNYTQYWTDSIDAQMKSAAEHIDCRIYRIIPSLFRQDMALASDIQTPREKIT